MRLHFESLARAAARRLLPRPLRRSLRVALGVPEEPHEEREIAFSIGMYAGRSPFALRPWREVRNPVLKASDVNDCNAQFVADPFMIEHEGQWHMFFEVYDRGVERGFIGLARSTDQRAWRYDGLVLKEDFHLSYPYVFREEGEILMIPECAETSSVRLYRAVRFPTEWTHEANLLECPDAVDASVFEYNGRWWMFVETSGGSHDTLRLFYACGLRGPWCEHPGSPLVNGNAHIARPAGRVVRYENRPMRFAQDCDPTYGRCVRAFQVLELTEDRYREAPAGRRETLAPGRKGWNRLGMHHVDAHEVTKGLWVACVDGQTAVPVPA